MKIKIEFLVLCENAIATPDNKLSLINIYDIIKAPNLPAYHGELTFAGKIIAEEIGKQKKLVGNISILSPSGKEMVLNGSSERDLADGKNTQKINIIFGVSGVLFSEYGEYTAIFTFHETSYKLNFSIRKDK
jgi:hypothetical protein